MTKSDQSYTIRAVKTNPPIKSLFYGTILSIVYVVWAWGGLIYSGLGMDPSQHELIQKLFYLSPIVLLVAILLIFRKLKTAPDTFKFSKLVIQFIGILILLSIAIELVMYPWGKL